MAHPRGRLWVTVWLVFVLVILAWVVARQTSSHLVARRLDELRTESSVYEAQRANLLARIREAESRAVLIPRAESLGMREAADSEIVILQAPAQERN
ncbi:MAG: hypothetical protein PVH40_09250 [Gemmatimonadales bacterium]|jgi:hypothetical protein